MILSWSSLIADNFFVILVIRRLLHQTRPCNQIGCQFLQCFFINWVLVVNQYQISHKLIFWGWRGYVDHRPVCGSFGPWKTDCRLITYWSVIVAHWELIMLWRMFIYIPFWFNVGKTVSNQSLIFTVIVTNIIKTSKFILPGTQFTAPMIPINRICCFSSQESYLRKS